MTAYEILEKCMREELMILEAFSAEQDKLEAAVSVKDWDGLYRTVAFLESLSEKARQAETLRGEAYSCCMIERGLSAETPFYQFSHTLSLLDRSRAQDYFRALKFAAMRIQARSSVFSGYLERNKRMLSHALSCLFPDSGGAGYTKSGARSEANVRSFVVNASL